MEEIVFEVGQRVRTKEDGLGTIVEQVTGQWGVALDKPTATAHSCGNLGPPNCCHWYVPNTLTLITPEEDDPTISTKVEDFPPGTLVRTVGGLEGRVIGHSLRRGVMRVGVEFGYSPSGIFHSCGGLGKANCCAWWTPNTLRRLDPLNALKVGGLVRNNDGEYGVVKKIQDNKFAVEHMKYNSSYGDCDKSCCYGYGNWYEPEEIYAVGTEDPKHAEFMKQVKDHEDYEFGVGAIVIWAADAKQLDHVGVVKAIAVDPDNDLTFYVEYLEYLDLKTTDTPRYISEWFFSGDMRYTGLAIGDKVIIDGHQSKYAAGTIITICAAKVGVHLEEVIPGDCDLNGLVPPGYGLWVYPTGSAIKKVVKKRVPTHVECPGPKEPPTLTLYAGMRVRTKHGLGTVVSFGKIMACVALDVTSTTIADTELRNGPFDGCFWFERDNLVGVQKDEDSGNTSTAADFQNGMIVQTATNRVGKVIAHNTRTDLVRVGVEFRHPIAGGTDCDGNGRPGQCEWYSPNTLTVVPVPTIGSLVEVNKNPEKLWGVVKAVDADYLGVEHTTPGFDFHECSGACARDYGYWYYPEDVREIAPMDPRYERTMRRIETQCGYAKGSIVMVNSTHLTTLGIIRAVSILPNDDLEYYVECGGIICWFQGAKLRGLGYKIGDRVETATSGLGKVIGVGDCTVGDCTVGDCTVGVQLNNRDKCWCRTTELWSAEYAIKVGDLVTSPGIGNGTVRSITGKTGKWDCKVAVELAEYSEERGDCGGICANGHGIWCEAKALHIAPSMRDITGVVPTKADTTRNMVHNGSFVNRTWTTRLAGTPPKLVPGDRVTVGDCPATVLDVDGDTVSVWYDDGLDVNNPKDHLREEVKLVSPALQVGDRVRTPNGDGTVLRIITYPHSPTSIGVRHDTASSDFHDCDGACERNHGWWYAIRDLVRHHLDELWRSEQRVVSSAGNTLGVDVMRAAYPEQTKLMDVAKGATEKENNMNINKLFGNVGLTNMGMFKGSMYGLAIRSRTDNTYVAFDGNNIIDVTDFVFDGDTTITIPVLDVEIGDLVLKGEDAVYVTALNNDGSIQVVNPVNQSIETFLPKKTPFGFSVFIKVWSLYSSIMPDMGVGGEFDPSMLIMMSMMNNKGTDMISPTAGSNTDMLMMMMAMMGKGDMGKMLPFLMMGGSGDVGKMLPFLMMSGNNPFSKKSTSPKYGARKYAKKQPDPNVGQTEKQE